MSPAEKAKEIFQKHYSILGYNGMMDIYFDQRDEAKRCALITAKELADECTSL